MTPSPSWDPLGYTTPLPLQQEFFPLGFPLDIETNSPDVLAAAAVSWPEPQGGISEPRLRLRVVVAPEEVGQPPVPRYRAHGKFLTLAADASHCASCDLEAGTAVCWVSAALAANHTLFRFHYLEGIVYQLLSYLRLTPVHASCVAAGEKGVLLSAPPGTGKSCLAFACALAGLIFVSDDVGYLLRDDSDGRLLGRPHFLRLSPSAIELFPDLRGAPVGADAGGEPVLEIPLGNLHGIRTATGCFAAATLFLVRRANTPAGLTAVEPREALSLLVRELPVIGERPNREQVASLASLVRRGAYRLTYSDLGGAVERVRELLQAGRGGAP